MFMLAFVSFVAALFGNAAPIALASSAPLPTAASAPAAPAIKPVQWQGVTLGEDIDSVRARFGKPEFNRKVILGSMLVEYPIHGGEGTLTLETSEHQVTQIRVEAAAPKQLGLPIGDPFGVDLGDGLTRLLTIRGNPTRSDDEGADESTTTYGGPNENRWIYTLHAGMIVAITLVAPRPLPVTGPSRPGLVLRGTPAPRRRVVLRGTPAPSATRTPSASGSPGPVATTSPTPIPGVALTPSPASAMWIGPQHATPPPTFTPLPKPSGTPNPNATPPADGSSIQTAIPVRAPDQASGFTYIYTFIQDIECGDGTAHYVVVDQTLSSQNRHNYAIITAECPTTKDRRAFYFDITYIFTRGER